MVKGRIFLATIALATLAACATLAGIDLDGAPAPTGSAAPAPTVDAAPPEPDPDQIVIRPQADVLKLAARCGEKAKQIITIRNGTAVDATWEASVVGDGAVAVQLEATTGMLVSTLSGPLVARATVEIPVVSPATTTHGTFQGANILITAKYSARPLATRQLGTEVTITGALLTLDPPLIDFGDAKPAEPTRTETVEIKNTGNDRITWQGFNLDGGDGTLTLEPTVVVLPPQATTKRTATLAPFMGNVEGLMTVDATPVIEGTHCGALPVLTVKVNRKH